MQYTGLKDNKGEEIYEGDILAKNGTFGVIEYCSETAAFCVKFRRFKFYFGVELSSVDISIVGNIYENPELLNQN